MFAVAAAALAKMPGVDPFPKDPPHACVAEWPWITPPRGQAGRILQFKLLERTARWNSGGSHTAIV